MSFLEHFKTELENNKVNYFIFDSKGDASVGDIDFVKYSWETTRFNKVREGDLVVFRRPGKASETKQFYFFGAAKIGSISGQGRVTAKLEKAYPFIEQLHKEELESFVWTFKDREETWEHFFNQYGMNQIDKMDFLNLLGLVEGPLVDFDPIAATDATQAMQKKDYSVDDEESVSKVRTKQNMFSNKVKNNYKGKCAICGLRTRAFLVGSHIVPWAVDKSIRLDPSNGISLCSLHDKAFDLGYFTLTYDYKVKITNRELNDEIIEEELRIISGKKIKLPSGDIPKQEYLEYHRNNIFESFK